MSEYQQICKLKLPKQIKYQKKGLSKRTELLKNRLAPKTGHKRI